MLPFHPAVVFQSKRYHLHNIFLSAPPGSLHGGRNEFATASRYSSLSVNRA